MQHDYDSESAGGGFDMAIRKLRNSVRMRRAVWLPLRFVVVMAPLELPPHSSQEPGAKVNDRTAKFIGDDTPLHSKGYFAKHYGQGHWQPGWLPDADDLLANDWEEYRG